MEAAQQTRSILARVWSVLTAPVAVLHNHTARLLLAQWALHTASFTLYTSCIALFANIVLGLDAQAIGLLLMSAGIIRVIIRFGVFVPLLNRIGERRTSQLGLGLFVLVFAGLGFVRTPTQFAIILSMASFSAACTRGVLTGFLSRAVGPTEQGKAMGASASLDSLAQIIGPTVGGYLLGAFPPLAYGGLATALALGAFSFAFRRIRFHGEDAEG
jgi:DHA1 family tetracycline resistance protein-like MFS transporter